MGIEDSLVEDEGELEFLGEYDPNAPEEELEFLGEADGKPVGKAETPISKEIIEVQPSPKKSADSKISFRVRSLSEELRRNYIELHKVLQQVKDLVSPELFKELDDEVNGHLKNLKANPADIMLHEKAYSDLRDRVWGMMDDIREEPEEAKPGKEKVGDTTVPTLVDIGMQVRMYKELGKDREPVILRINIGGETRDASKQTLEIKGSDEFICKYNPSLTVAYAMRSVAQKVLRNLDECIGNIVTAYVLRVEDKDSRGDMHDFVYPKEQELCCDYVISPYILLRRDKGQVWGLPLFPNVLPYYGTFRNIFSEYPDTGEKIPDRENIIFEMQLRDNIRFQTPFGDYTERKLYDLYSFLAEAGVIPETMVKPMQADSPEWKEVAGYMRLAMKIERKKEEKRRSSRRSGRLPFLEAG